MLNGVGQQVEQDVMQQAGIDADQRQAGGNLKVDGMAAEQILEVMDDTRDHIGQVHRLDVEADPPDIGPDQFDQLFEERAEEHTPDIKSLISSRYPVSGWKKKT